MTVRYRGGPHAYELEEGWDRMPAHIRLHQVCGVAVDSRDRVFLFHRGERPVVVLDRQGEFVDSWDLDLIDPHGIHVGPDGSVYIADRDAHVVMKYTPDGAPLLTLGTWGQPSDTGATEIGTPVKRAAGPFNGPSGIAVSREGDIFVSDGYFNARVHRFLADGELLLSWGAPGYEGPGEFNLVHGVVIDNDGRVIVCDRQNHRLQVFDQQGKHVATWTGFRKPGDVAVDAEGTVFVAELDHRVTVLDGSGNVLDRWGGERSEAPGGFTEPHGIAIDSRGDVYIAEVMAGGRVQKFVRVPLS